MDERAAEGEQPDDGEDDGKTGDDLGVDEAALVPRRRSLGEVEVLARQTGDDGSECQLRQAEDHGQEINENHVGGSERGDYKYGKVRLVRLLWREGDCSIGSWSGSES